VTRWHVATAVLLVLCTLLGVAAYRARAEAHDLARLAAVVDAARAGEAQARADLARLEERHRVALADAAEARRAAEQAQAQVVERVRVVVRQEREVLAQPPTVAGARESLARAAAFAEARHLVLGPPPAATSTATGWQGAAARWETSAEAVAAHLDAAVAQVGAARAAARALGVEVEAARAEGAAEAAHVRVQLARAEERAESRVSRLTRTTASVGALVAGAGLATAVVGGALCSDARCREVALGAGGAAVALGGTTWGLSVVW